MVKINTKQFDHVMTIRCIKCASDHVIFVKTKDYVSWLSGSGFIQDIMPYLSASDRELLISNICGDCFDKMIDSIVDKTFG